MNVRCTTCNAYGDFRNQRGNKLSEHRCKCGGSFKPMQNYTRPGISPLGKEHSYQSDKEWKFSIHFNRGAVHNVQEYVLNLAEQRYFPIEIKDGLYILKMDPKLLQLDKEISYFISSHSIDGENGEGVYTRPRLPDPEMGDVFIGKTIQWLDSVDQWIRRYPERFQAAQNGYYKIPSTIELISPIMYELHILQLRLMAMIKRQTNEG